MFKVKDGFYGLKVMGDLVLPSSIVVFTTKGSLNDTFRWSEYLSVDNWETWNFDSSLYISNYISSPDETIDMVYSGVPGKVLLHNSRIFDANMIRYRYIDYIGGSEVSFRPSDFMSMRNGDRGVMNPIYYQGNIYWIALLDSDPLPGFYEMKLCRADDGFSNPVILSSGPSVSYVGGFANPEYHYMWLSGDQFRAEYLTFGDIRRLSFPLTGASGSDTIETPPPLFIFPFSGPDDSLLPSYTLTDLSDNIVGYRTASESSDPSVNQIINFSFNKVISINAFPVYLQTKTFGDMEVILVSYESPPEVEIYDRDGILIQTIDFAGYEFSADERFRGAFFE